MKRLSKKDLEARDGKRITLTRSTEGPDLSNPADKKWKPKEGHTKTMVYGKGTPTPSPTAQEMAAKDVAEYYPYLLIGSPEYDRRLKEYLALY